ncbi:MAG TPA: hypothetical protein VKP67_09940 [Xanthobacteraceae bacterium]|nr:hypothetical protein [Xanthobacteraceae bacterium]
MRYHSFIGTVALAASFTIAFCDAQAFDQTKYPDWTGAWRRIPVQGVTGQPGYDQTKRLGPAQQAPLTPEAEAVLKASMEDQAKGGQGNYPTYVCISPGMPRVMTPYGAMEFVITPDTTHIFIEHVHDSRRIFTDDRDWPKDIRPTLQGYSIGKWIDTDGDGRFDTLEVETRGLRGPRAFDASGMPLFSDPDSRVLERISVGKSNPNVMLNEMTTIDKALTRPWTVVKKYGRNPKETPDWAEENCAEGNGHVVIQGQGYFLGGDGNLMPTSKGQPPPDLRFFQQPSK